MSEQVVHEQFPGGGEGGESQEESNRIQHPTMKKTHNFRSSIATTLEVGFLWFES